MTILRLVLPKQRNLKFHAQAVSCLASILVFALAMAGKAAAQVAPQVGPYGFVLNATYSTDISPDTLPPPGNGAGMWGVMNFDGAGNVSGHYALELGTGYAAINQESLTGHFTGIYYMNPPPPQDPNAITWTVSLVLDDSVDHSVDLGLTMVVNDLGRGLQLALTSGCFGPICDFSQTVVGGVGEAEFNGAAHPMHLGSLNGSYGMQSIKSAPTPQTSVEVWTFDGAGHVTLSGTGVVPGPGVGNYSVRGTYTVNPDGTGTITHNLQTFVFVITNGHSGLLVLQRQRLGDGVEYLIGRVQ
jgi:hypothetical protein